MSRQAASISAVTAPLSPDPAQAQVLEHTGGPLLVTGGPGTGKTAVLLERFARLVEDADDPERVVLVVGSIHARDEARARLLARLAGSLPGLQVVTIHGLAHRIVKQHASIVGEEPPHVLSAVEQFARVRELLARQDPAAWPAYGHLLELRGFADEVRGFVLRAQESMRTPEDIRAAAERRGLGGWAELARFLDEYRRELERLGQVDFAMLLQRAAAAAAATAPAFDHVLVDDYQDTTLAAEAILERLAAPDLVVAGDPEAHVFSFQGSTVVPLTRFAERFRGAREIRLLERHRAPEGVRLEGWVAPHASEQHAAIARELRRLHVDEGVPWGELAVVVRRQGADVAGLLRALDDAGIPRAVPERDLSLGSEPATAPYILALRWLVADANRREELVEHLLTSEVVGLSPAAARGILRAAQFRLRTIARALELDEGLAPAEAEAVRRAFRVLTKAELFAPFSVQDAFKVLWEELPCSRRLVERAATSQQARRELDTVVTFARLIGEASGQGDVGVEVFLEQLDAGEHGPGYSRWERTTTEAVRVLTAHGTVGREFDTVIVADAAEGNFPSLARPEPMFDLAALDRPITRSERTRERLQDERRLFGVVLGRARRRVVLACSDAHPDDEVLSARTRFGDELGVRWAPAPAGPFDDPVSTREAQAAWRRQLADRDAEAWRRLAALEGLVALGVDPSRWWFQLDWTDTGHPLHGSIRASYSRLSTLENCELQHVLADELGLGRPAGYQAWVGKLVHRIIEECERGELERSQQALVKVLDERWREQEFPSRAVSVAFRRLAEDPMLRNWYEGYGNTPALATEQRFEFEFDGATIVGVIDRIGPITSGGTRITDFKTGNHQRAEKAEENLQLGIYFLAVQLCDELAPYRPVRAIELAFVKGNWRGELVKVGKQVNRQNAERYEREMRARLAHLIAEKHRLNDEEVYRPNPHADCHWCEFKSLCPLWPEGRPLLHPEVSLP